MTLKDLVMISFKNCLWVLGNISGLKEQALGEALDLLLMFISSDGPASLIESRQEAVKAFVENVEVENVWRLVFSTIKLKCEPLKAQINKLFTVINFEVVKIGIMPNKPIVQNIGVVSISYHLSLQEYILDKNSLCTLVASLICKMNVKDTFLMYAR